VCASRTFPWLAAVRFRAPHVTAEKVLQPYVSLLMLFLFVAANAVGMVVLSHVLSATRPTAVKDQPYESGMPPLGSAHERFDVKFYLIAVLFIVFDIEVVFMIPWAVAWQQLDLFGMGPLGAILEMGVFVLILVVGYVYVLKRGALEWT
jgi:NADH-quinone oxidoreductase subunit A